MVAAKKIEIEISGRIDALNQAFREAQNKATSFQRSIAATQTMRADMASTADPRRIIDTGYARGAGGAGGMEASFAKSLEHVLKLGGAIKGVELGLSVAAGAVSAFRGDAEGVRRAAESIPVLGIVLAGVFAIGDAATQKTVAQLEQIKKRTEENAEATKKWVDEYTRVQNRAMVIADSIKSLNAEGRTIGLKGRDAELVGVSNEEEQRLSETYDLDVKLRIIENANRKRQAINEKYDKEELRAKQQLESDKMVAVAKYAGDELRARQEQIRQQYRSAIEDAPDAKSRGLILARQNYELAQAAKDDQDKRVEERKKVASEAFDRYDAARKQAADNLKNRTDALSNQRLSATDAGFLTRGVSNGLSEDLLKDQNRLTEETNRILREQTAKEKEKAAYVQAVTF